MRSRERVQQQVREPSPCEPFASARLEQHFYLSDSEQGAVWKKERRAREPRRRQNELRNKSHDELHD